MSWSFDTNSRYHTQDTSYYCGAACAMMVLSEIGVSYADLDQDDLYTSNHDHNVQPGWYSDPYGVRFTLMDRKPASFANSFVVYKPTTEAEGTRKIVYTLQHYQVSPIVMVYGCAHWIVVRGVQTDVDPGGGGPYVVEGFWVNNPVWEDNEPHGAGDVCGGGGAHGVEAQWVSYADWQATYFTGCAYDSGNGTLQYISVCDPDTPTIAEPRAPKRERRFDGRKLIGAGQAAEVFWTELERRFTQSRDPSKVARRVAERFGRARLDPGQALLVKRLDRKDDFYWLVPALADGEGIAGWGQVDARFGDLQSLYLLNEGAKRFDTRRSGLGRRITGKRFDLGDGLGRLNLRPGTFCVHPTLVWRPCRQSYSPHLPFWMITAGADTLYVRIDGRVYPALADAYKGS